MRQGGEPLALEDDRLLLPLEASLEVKHVDILLLAGINEDRLRHIAYLVQLDEVLEIRRESVVKLLVEALQRNLLGLQQVFADGRVCFEVEVNIVLLHF